MSGLRERKGRLSGVKRIKAFWVAVVMVVMLAGSAILAQAQEDSLVFIPPQFASEGGNSVEVTGPGVTFSCVDRPFTENPFTGGGTCDFEQNGQPKGLVCDIPTTLVFDFPIGPSVQLDAFLCREPGGGGGPLTQEIGQESESGEVDIAFEVSSSGDYAQQCAAPSQSGETGNLQNGQGALQNGTTLDDLEFGGSTFGVEPSSETACEGAVQQAAAASG